MRDKTHFVKMKKEMKKNEKRKKRKPIQRRKIVDMNFEISDIQPKNYPANLEIIDESEDSAEISRSALDHNTIAIDTNKKTDA